MKNFLILGLLALLLFSISASLSLWLNQSKQTDTTEKDKDKEKAVAKGPKTAEPKETVEPRPPGPKTSTPSAGITEAEMKRLREYELKLADRAARMEVVIRDIQTQRESTEAALRAVMNELKTVSTETTKLDAMAEDLNKKRVEFETTERKNLEKIATMYDAMSPETAAPILKQMAESGRLDMAAKILVLMKERNAARVLEAMNDPALGFQVLEKMRGLRPASAPPPAPATIPGPGTSPVVPAKGP